MLKRGIAVRQGIGFLRTELPAILATRTDALWPRMLRVIEELAVDWRRLDQRIDGLSGEIEALARQDQACSRLMTVPGIGPIISSAMVAAIGTGEVFSNGRDFLMSTCPCSGAGPLRHLVKFDKNAADKFRQNKTAFATNASSRRKPHCRFQCGPYILRDDSMCP
jgi:transposase